MTLDAVLNKARALEAAVSQGNKMEREADQTTLAMRHKKPNKEQPKRQDKQDQQETVSQPKQPTDLRSCSFCGGQFTTCYNAS